MDSALFLALKEEVHQRLEAVGSTTDEMLMEFIEESVFSNTQKNYLSTKQKHALILKIYHSFRGLDVLQPMMDDPTITEIMINSYNEIFVEQDGRSFQYPEAFESQQKLEDIIQTIVGKVNRVVNESTPIVDARLKNGSRVNVVLPPIALKGPTMTIRKFPEKPLTMKDLIAKGAITEEAAEFLKQLVKAKYNIFIGGGTGSGKTTFLNALSNYIPEDERIITIEDSAELQIQRIPNLVQLETRNSNTEGKGEITIRDLIRSSLRMRPNRIIVGEVRGAEALDMLQAMNTGHDGSLSTGHGNSSQDMLSRLETMVLSGANLPIEVIRKQIGSAIDIMIHLSRLRDNTRKVMAISELVHMERGELILIPLYEFMEVPEEVMDGHIMPGQVVGRLHATGKGLQNELKLRLAGIGKVVLRDVDERR